MKLYLIERSDYWSYDDYDATVVAAPTENKARVLALALFASGDIASNDESLELTLLAESTLSTEGIILSSFNAG